MQVPPSVRPLRPRGRPPRWGTGRPGAQRLRFWPRRRDPASRAVRMGEGCGGEERRRAYFTLPAVSPDRQYRWSSRNATTSGNSARSEPITING
ncbi:hypothetical protein GCM10010284_46870 [Streptomyces rubiginosohelvolus]|nr:hypothetical protein GCM10010284_46870 [Streptomyces rubiginosohelvolus]